MREVSVITVRVIVSQLLKDNLMEAVDIQQLESFQAGCLFAQAEGIKMCIRDRHNTAYMEYDWNFHKILLPIPKKEMDANPNMKQNPGYVD